MILSATATRRVVAKARNCTSSLINYFPPFVPSRKLVTTPAASPSAVSKIDKDGNSILVNWSQERDSWSKYHFDWLRDNCPCTKCKHPEYDQRLLNSLEDPIPAEVDVKGSDAVGIKWRDGHDSQYTYSWLLANSYWHNNIITETVEKREKTLWDSDSTVTINPPEIHYNDIMTDDKKLLTLLRNLYQYGFCFVLNTPCTKEAMVKAASRIGPILNTYYGLQWQMTAGDIKIKLVTA